MASIASRSSAAQTSQTSVPLLPQAWLRWAAVGWVALLLAGATALPRTRGTAGRDAPAGVDVYFAAATSAASRARVCAQELSLLVREHPGAASRAVQLEDDGGEAGPATALAFLDRQLAATTSSVDALQRLASARARSSDWREIAGGLAMRSHRASDRLCAARDAAAGATALHRM